MIRDLKILIDFPEYYHKIKSENIFKFKFSYRLVREIKLDKLGAKNSIFDVQRNSVTSTHCYDVNFSQVQKKMPGLVGFASGNTNDQLRSLTTLIDTKSPKVKFPGQ